MSSGDVIELGSSDEESEPAPKKTKLTKNAMLSFPRKLHEVTIKPAKPSSSSVAEKRLGKEITVTKIPNKQSSTKNRINPCSILKKPALTVSKPNSSKLVMTNSKISSNLIVCKPIGPITYKPQKILTPGIGPPVVTIKNSTLKRPIVTLNVKKQNNKNQRKNKAVDDVMTVELDDDDTPAPSSNPAWYLRPEEQTETITKQEENNKEPETNFIEITIEDSPIKPVHNKKAHEIGAELAITIDDSPVKIADKNRTESQSDDEQMTSGRVPPSKKMLEYPKESENKTVEIELVPIVYNKNISNPPGKTVDAVARDSEDKNGSNKNLKGSTAELSTPKKNIVIPAKENETNIPSKSSEFHPTYQSFIDLCFKLENSEDMNKIVEKKIKGYYRQVPKEYTESEEFIDMVSSKILSMQAGPEKMYLYIKDVVDELNLQRKLAKSLPVVKEPLVEEAVHLYGEESEFDSKRQRQIRKLEKTIKKLHRAIQKLEEQEVDFDDDDDSVYLLTERYKERMVRVYAKFCQLSNTKMPSEPRIQIDARPGRPAGPAKRLEKWVNKKVPIGSPLPFPDFHDVLRCVREANNEDKLGFNEVDIMEEARDLFTRCGRKLQRRRQENEWRLAASRIALDVDPAENSEELKKKLNENKKLASNKEIEIFNKYADRQNQLKLEAVEIGDKEAEESPVESGEEEEVNDDSVSLETKQKRKERLKRLLHKKSKQTSEEKENQPSNEDQQISESNTTEAKDEKEMDVTNNKEKEQSGSPRKEDGTEENTEQITNDKEASDAVTLSEDSNELESDIDELHLLQKLHSGNDDQSSTAESSNSESPIAISDSLESCDDNKEVDDEVFSIENSSYSENEEFKVDNPPAKNMDSVEIINEDSNTSSQHAITTNENPLQETESNCVNAITSSQTNNEEYTEAVEDILLASSGDEDCNEKTSNTDGACVNLRDDMISIDEQVISDVNKEVGIEKKPSSPIVEMEIDKINSIGSNSGDLILTKDDEIKEKSVESDNVKSNIEATGKNADITECEKPIEAEQMDVDETENSGEKSNVPIDNNPETS